MPFHRPTIVPALALAALLLPAAAGAQAPAPMHQPLLLSSTAFADNGVIPDPFTQAAGPAAVSPPLAWTGTPAGTQSFTIILHDPDAAPHKNSADVLHWLAFNIPGTATSLPQGVATTPTLPDGTVQILNTGGHPGFMGPGSRGVYHHYTFELYALDTKLALGPDATRDQVMAAMDGHVIGKAALEARFHR